MNRRTYMVRFPDDSRTYRPVPHDETRSCLMRDKVLLGELRVSPGGGHVTPAAWRSSSQVLPAEAALGYALAVGLGTGGKRSEGGSGGGSAAARRRTRCSTSSRPGRRGRVTKNSP
ncbi:hypothetical protein [Streptomyces aureoversilis]|uniref:Uncharacterized protein n=1 Tax=Streptomyces aureoversilis TaxID=67277 RepID=A0ABW0A727_9ACTN